MVLSFVLLLTNNEFDIGPMHRCLVEVDSSRYLWSLGKNTSCQDKLDSLKAKIKYYKNKTGVLLAIVIWTLVKIQLFSSLPKPIMMADAKRTQS